MNRAPNGSAGVLTRREALQRAALYLGCALTPSILSGVLRAQPALAGTARSSRDLSPRQLDLAAAIADRILPRTGTPGALDVGVLTFIDVMYGGYLSDEERQRFANGLELADAAAHSAYQGGYGQLPPELKDRVLQGMADASAAEEKSFFLQIKELTIVGYFTSETVGKNVLRYDPVPGAYQGCIPLSEVGPATWTPSR
jgi:gluconate 2-dehydrogenase gamma chain